MNIPWSRPKFFINEKKYLNEAFDSSWISGGSFIQKFEAQMAHIHNIKHALSVSNGTTALHLALLALNIKSGDEVIVPGYGFIAAANMVVMVGAKPIFCDIDPDTWLIDPKKIENLITTKTKAIIPIHSYGVVCDMGALRSVALRHNIPLIEDVAESTFSKFNGKMAGTLGDIGTFSFHATKTITTGEGGMVLVNSDELNEKMSLIRSHGMKGPKYWHVEHAHNFRLTNMQAAIGCGQLEAVESIIDTRRKIYATYKEYLSGNEKIKLQAIPSNVEPVMWVVGVKILNCNLKKRNLLLEQMQNKGIECRPGFYTASALPIFSEVAPIPVSEEIANQTIVLPFHLDLTTKEIEYVCQTLVQLI